MKIAVTSQGPNLASPVDPRFGRARYFVVVETESDRVTAHDNAQNAEAPQGAGIQAAKVVTDLSAAAVITGNVGPKAFGALQASGIPVYTGASGTVEEAIEGFKAGQLQPAEQANVEGRWT